MTIISESHTLNDAVNAWKQYASQNNPEDVWFFVENTATKDAVVRQLDQPALSSRITTLQEFATNLVADHCKSTHLLTTDEQLIILHDIVSDSKWNTNNASPAFMHELLGRYNFFRKNGITLDQYRGTETKHGILCDIFDRYQAACGTTNLDSVGIVQKAIELVKKNNPVKFAVIYNLNPTELLLQELRDAVRGYCDAEPADRSNITEYRVSEYRIERPTTLKDIRKYSTSRDEIEAVLDSVATLIESGCDPQDILILTPSISESAALIRDTIGDFYYLKENAYLPLTCTPIGAPLSSFPIIQCIMAALSAQLTGFRLADLETVAASTYFTCPKDKLDACITPDRLRELSIVANVSEKETEWKSAAYRLGSDKGLQSDAAKIEPLLSWIKQIASPRASQTFAERTAQLKRWLADSGWSAKPVSAQDQKARGIFLEYLDRIAGKVTGGISVTLPVFIATIREYIQTKEVRVSGGSGIRLEKLRKAGDLQAKHVFIIGLTADNLPNLTTALSPFSMKETSDLCRLPDGTSFSLPDRQFEETRRNFAAALRTAVDGLHLSCYVTNGANSSAPSSFLTKLDEPESVPVVTVTHSVWYNQIEAGRRIRTVDDDQTPLLGIIDTDSLAERIEREQNGYTSDFRASPVKELFEKQNRNRQYSPTEIEKYLNCPYRWYLDKHLGLRNPQDKYAEYSKLGTLVHDALKDFFSQNSKDEISKKPFDELYAKLLKCVQTQLDSEHIIDSPGWDAKKDWYLDRIHGFKGIIRQFLEQEIEFAREGWETTAEMTEYRIANPDPVEITFGDRIMKVHGSIDRIMMNGEKFRVVDYKTGKSFENDLKHEKLVQIPLYTEAYKAKTGMTPDKEGYYFKLTPNECKTVPLSPKKNEKYDDMYQRILASAFDARDQMSAGNCSRAEKCDDKYCPYKGMCRGSATAEGESDD